MLIRPGRLTIDSAGISFPRHGRPRDRGSEQRDRGQYNQVELVDAISGAAMMIRSESFRTLSMGGEIFDESFFAYHEDTDLCWRARRLGWSVLFDPSAVAVHTRGWRKDRRGEIDVRIRRHSFKNHYLQLTKNQTRSEFIKNLPWLMVWEVLRIGFVLVKDRQMLPAYRDALKAMPGALAKRRELNRRVAKSGQNTRTDR
jgi:GT2 family glycosyltransferase